MATMKFPRGKSAVVGAATYGMGAAPGHEALDLAVRASLLALADADLEPSDVDGLFTTLPQDPFSTLTIAEYFGIHPMVTDNVRTGGSSFQIQAMWAALALDAGLCDVALIAYGSNQRSAAGKLVSSGGGVMVAADDASDDGDQPSREELEAAEEECEPLMDAVWPPQVPI